MSLRKTSLKPYPAPEAEAETDGGGGDGVIAFEAVAKILMEGVLAMKQAMQGGEVYFHGDHARVCFDVPLGADPDCYFEKAKKAYLELLENLRQKLEPRNS